MKDKEAKKTELPSSILSLKATEFTRGGPKGVDVESRDVRYDMYSEDPIETELPKPVKAGCGC